MYLRTYMGEENAVLSYTPCSLSLCPSVHIEMPVACGLAPYWTPQSQAPVGLYSENSQWVDPLSTPSS